MKPARYSPSFLSIDAAVATPTVYAGIRSMSRESTYFPDYEYIGTRAKPPLRNPIAQEARRRDGAHFSYYSMAVVRKKSKITDCILGPRDREGKSALVYTAPI